jgi:hypothetical protein
MGCISYMRVSEMTAKVPVVFPLCPTPNMAGIIVLSLLVMCGLGFGPKPRLRPGSEGLTA